jgi:hypothetical protein
LGSRIFGFKLSSASVSSQKMDSTLDVVVFPISGHLQQSNCAGALACCMYAWNGSKWVPYRIT